MPFFEIFLAHCPREAGSVVARSCVDSGLRVKREAEFGQFEDSFCTLEAINFGALSAEVQPHVNGDVSILEESCVNVGHVAAIFPAQDSAHGHGSLRRLVDAKHIHHAADEVDEQIAGYASAVLLPAPPAREQEWIESPLWNGTLPRIPVERLRRKIERRWILPRAGRIVAAERAFHQHQIAKSSFCDQVFRLSANY